MSKEIPIHFTGNLADDPTLRFTPTGLAVANFTVAVTERVKEGDEWKDGGTTWMRCSVWRQYAENIAESLAKGNRVLVIGSLRQREYQTNEGEKRSAWEVDVDEVGPALRYATAKVNKIERGGGGFPAAAESDPWATPAATAQTNPIPF